MIVLRLKDNSLSSTTDHVKTQEFRLTDNTTLYSLILHLINETQTID